MKKKDKVWSVTRLKSFHSIQKKLLLSLSSSFSKLKQPLSPKVAATRSHRLGGLLLATFRHTRTHTHTLQINDVARGLFLESTRSHKEEANWNKSKELSSFFFLSDVK